MVYDVQLPYISSSAKYRHINLLCFLEPSIYGGMNNFQIKKVTFYWRGKLWRIRAFTSGCLSLCSRYCNVYLETVLRARRIQLLDSIIANRRIKIASFQDI
jgi:hypothetical protein